MKDLLNIEILTKTFDDLPHGVGIFHVLDLNDINSIQYVFMNKVILYEMRKEREEVFGKKITDVAPEAYEHEGGLQVIETYRKVAAEGVSINLGLVEYSNHMVAGSYECSVHHIEDNYIYVMLRNVTELEKAKNELEQKNKELGQFAHIVSHDLKEPLNSLSSLVELPENECQGKLDEKANEVFSLISKSTGRMKNLIKDILDYSTIGQEKEMNLVNCKNLVEVIQEDLKTIIKDTNTTMEVGDLPEVKGYSTELRLLFQNLISNAIKFSKPGVAPKIKISAKEQDGWIFAVQDNGIGIADEHQDKIFAIFQRLHSRSE
jgi:signal transduction histidine kinase